MRDLYCPPAFPLAIVLSLIGITKVAAQQSTTATYDDWVLQCQTVSGPPAQKICDIAQVTEVQGKNLPLSRVAISRAAKGQPFRLVVQVPVNVSLRANVLIQVNQSDPGLAAPFDRCVPAGCFADFELKEESIKKFLGGPAAGKITFKTANEQTASIPISFKGFAQAINALTKP
jgi:invasion protein IalB